MLDATTPTSRYDFSIASGVVVNTQLNLMWQRCPLGYQLEDGGTEVFLEHDRCEVASVTEFF